MTKSKDIYEARLAAKRLRARRQAWKPVRDAMVAFALFPLLTLAVGSGPLLAGPTSIASGHLSAPDLVVNAVADSTPAPLVEIATVSAHNTDGAVYRRTSFAAAWMLLGASFALIVALNLAVARHIGRTYGSRKPSNLTTLARNAAKLPENR